MTDTPGAPKRLTLNQQAEQIIADPKTNDELRSKLTFAVEVVTQKRAGSIDLMRAVRNNLIREATRKRF